MLRLTLTSMLRLLPSHSLLGLHIYDNSFLFIVKEFDDFSKLVDIIQQFCHVRQNHFHSVGNIEVGEIVFFQSSLLNGIYTRAEVVVLEAES